MDEYQIALSPDLGLSSADFITIWNEDTETHAITEARLAPSSSTQYDPTLVAAILLSIGTGIAGNTLYDLIKRILVKKAFHSLLKSPCHPHLYCLIPTSRGDVFPIGGPGHRIHNSRMPAKGEGVATIK